MHIFKRLLITVIGVVMVVSTVVMLTPNANEAKVSNTISIGALFGKGKCDVPPTWGEVIRGKKRWVAKFLDKRGKPHAYCDRQTGLVLQRTPGMPPNDFCGNTDGCTWHDARLYCANLTVGDSGQKGWRLLYIQELAALVDTNSKSCTNDNLCLPDGHPFKEVQSAGYWSASLNADLTSLAWFVDFFGGQVIFSLRSNEGGLAWCGRGASATDTY
jgi:hypothetical protein